MKEIAHTFDFDTPLDEVTQKLITFTQSYYLALNAKIDQLGRENFPYHSEPLAVILLIKAADGFLTFYLPIEQTYFTEGFFSSVALTPSLYVKDISFFTIDRILATLHFNTIRLLDYLAFDAPPEIETISDIRDRFCTRELANWVVQQNKMGNEIGLDKICIVPICHMENGKTINFLPSHTTLWSPVGMYQGLGYRRTYTWLRVDVWLKPESLDLDASKAPQLAEQDAIAFLTVLQNVDSFDINHANRPTNINAADLLEKCCLEFMDLLNSHGHDEEAIHQWLNQKKHHIFLDPHPAEVRSKQQFGKRFSDFVIRHPNNTYALIEIESASVRFFTPGGQEPSSEFNHACQQVKDWRQYIRENTHTVRDTLSLPDIYEPEGIVILGRRHNIEGAEALRRWRDMKNDHEFRLFTYDDLHDRVLSLADTLRHHFGQ